MQKAINKLVTQIKKEIAERHDMIKKNEKTFEKIDEEFSAVFQDKKTLLTMDPDLLQETITKRIDYFENEKSKKVAEAKEKPSKSTKQESEPKDEAEAETEELASPSDETHIISIEILAQVDAAQELFDEIDNRYSDRKIVGAIKKYKQHKAPHSSIASEFQSTMHGFLHFLTSDFVYFLFFCDRLTRFARFYPLPILPDPPLISTTLP